MDEFPDLSDKIRISYDKEAVTRWIERLPPDVKAALQKDGESLMPASEVKGFHFPDDMCGENPDFKVIAELGSGGRTWLLSRLLGNIWPNSDLAKEVFEMPDVGPLLLADLDRLKRAYAIRMLRFLINCKEFRQGLQAIQSSR